MYRRGQGRARRDVADERPTAEEPAPLVLRAVANIMLGRGDDAHEGSRQSGRSATRTTRRCGARSRLRGRANGPRRAKASARSKARSATLPLELQRIALQEALRAAIEVGDFGDAANLLNEFETHRPRARASSRAVSVLTGPHDRRRSAASQDALDGLSLRRATPPTGRRRRRAGCARSRCASRSARSSAPDAIAALETLTTAWRGDETEAEALQLLGAALHRGQAATATRSTSCARR